MAQQRLAYDLLPPCYLSGLWLQHRCFGIRVRDLGKQSSTKPDRKSIKKGRQINFGYYAFDTCELRNTLPPLASNDLLN